MKDRGQRDVGRSADELAITSRGFGSLISDLWSVTSCFHPTQSVCIKGICFFFFFFPNERRPVTVSRLFGKREPDDALMLISLLNCSCTDASETACTHIRNLCKHYFLKTNMNTSRSAQFTVIQGLFLEVGPAGRKVRSRIRVQWDEPMQWSRASAQSMKRWVFMLWLSVYTVFPLCIAILVKLLWYIADFFLICVIFAISRNIVKSKQKDIIK